MGGPRLISNAFEIQPGNGMHTNGGLAPTLSKEPDAPARRALIS